MNGKMSLGVSHGELKCTDAFQLPDILPIMVTLSCFLVLLIIHLSICKPSIIRFDLSFVVSIGWSLPCCFNNSSKMYLFDVSPMCVAKN